MKQIFKNRFSTVVLGFAFTAVLTVVGCGKDSNNGTSSAANAPTVQCLNTSVNGYNNGYNNGYTSYNNGYNNGYNNTYNQGYVQNRGTYPYNNYNSGYNNGYVANPYNNSQNFVNPYTNSYGCNSSYQVPACSAAGMTCINSASFQSAPPAVWSLQNGVFGHVGYGWNQGYGSAWPNGTFVVQACDLNFPTCGAGRCISTGYGTQGYCGQ